VLTLLKEELAWHWLMTTRLIRLTPPWVLVISFVAKPSPPRALHSLFDL
jgi:hypothetical protein